LTVDFQHFFFGGRLFFFGWDLGRPETISNCFSISPETQEEGGRHNGTSKKEKQNNKNKKIREKKRRAGTTTD
jgi:hypothetical protein